MSLEQALKELQVHADNLASIGDLKEYVNDNRNEFFHKYIKVLQYFKYIEKNSKQQGEIYFDALDILVEIGTKNPSLGKFMNGMAKMELFEDIPKKVQNLTTKIEKLNSNIEQVWYRKENFDDMEWALDEAKKELIELKEHFSLTEYDRLMFIINNKLDNIEKLTKLEQSVNSAYNL